jgi:hypothetical protein
MSSLIFLALAVLYLAFWLWWGGNGRPMKTEELNTLMHELQATGTTKDQQHAVDEVRDLMASDDGKSFVMQNLVRYRPKAMYPTGLHYTDDPREADKRYAKSIIWPLLSNGNMVLFVGKKSGNFIIPNDADDWHYVAMVRYRSRRDFLRFAIASNQAEKFIHKWAAIEKTHVFPVKPFINLFTTRLTVGLMLIVVGLIAHALLR